MKKKRRWQAIFKYVKSPKCGIEIGVRDGKCSVELLKYYPNLFLYLIDPWAEYDLSPRPNKSGEMYVPHTSLEKQEEFMQKTIDRVKQYAKRYKIYRVFVKHGVSRSIAGFISVSRHPVFSDLSPESRGIVELHERSLLLSLPLISGVMAYIKEYLFAADNSSLLVPLRTRG